MAHVYEHKSLNHFIKTTGNKTISLSELDLFEILPNQNSVESREFVEFHPEACSLAEQSSIIEFSRKPCFFVFGLDFFYFNTCGALFSSGSIKYIYFDFKSFSTKIFGKVWSQIGFSHLFAHFDGWKSIQ